MIAIITGIATGLLAIIIINLFRQINKQLMYGLILTGIGYLYVGFNWTNTSSLIICAIQSVVFLFIAYYGVQKSLLILAAGYFLHGIWDLLFDLFPYSGLMPPHYDFLCLSVDFTMGIYLLMLSFKKGKKRFVAIV
ncbi:MAG: DUF6010 family protein [Mucilaginibacter sp.]